MNPTLEPLPASAETPRRVPRFLSCLVKGPLGCLAFALGAAVVIVLLLPPALGRVLDRTIERWFAAHHEGRLELGDAWLGSFYGSQRIERLILRDPDGDEVLRAELSAPSLAELFDGPARRYRPVVGGEVRADPGSTSPARPAEDSAHHFGPIVLRVDLLHVVESEDGTTNLERALAELPVEETAARERGISTDVPFRFELEVLVARLRTSAAHGRTTELSNLSFHGTLEWGPDETRLVLEGGSDPGQNEPLRLRLDLSRPEFGRARPWKSALSLEGAPTALAHAACPAARPLAPFAGARTDRVSCSRDGSEVAFLFEDEGARFELLGEEADGIVSGPEESVLAATLPCSSEAGRALLATLLPLVTDFECADPSGSHALRLANWRWPLDGDWSALSGDLELALAPARYELVPPLQGELGELAPFALEARMRVRDGVLECEQVAYPFERGVLRVGGTIELPNGASELALTTERDGTSETRRLVGDGDSLVPAPAELPIPPAPADGVPDPPGEER